jgi:hypothetical protein
MTRNEKASMGAEIRLMMAKYYREDIEKNDLPYQKILVHMVKGAEKVFRAGLRYSMDESEIDDYLQEIKGWAYDDARNELLEDQE